MAQLLIRVVDKVHPDFYENTKNTKRGDVVMACPDDWVWGSEAMTAPYWRIIKHTQLPLSEAQALMTPELDVDPQNPSRTLQKRAFKLNIDAAALPQAIKTWLADDSRATPVLDVTPLVNLTNFRALKVTKPPIQDPNIIG